MPRQALAKILLVDDQPNNLVALQDILEDVEADLLTAGSGNEALSLVMQHDVALVLLDVQMPGMDGLEVATLMRQVTQCKHIPIIFVTAHDDNPETTFKGYEAGAVDYIQKPIAAQVLESKVKVFLELFRQRQQIKCYSEELEERVKQRTEELQIALAASEAASRAKTEFLANTSHELRTPLNSLLILAQSLSSNHEGNLTPDQVEAVDVICQDGRSLLLLINDILDLAKVESGQMTAQADPVDFGDLAETLHKQFVPLAEQKGLQLQNVVADDLPAGLKTDVQKVEQTLRNLLSNAIKFTETGSVTLRIGRADAGTLFARNDLTSDEVVAISVTDTGIGIPKDKQVVIFESFQQVDGSTTRAYGGTGLGLTISRQFATLLGGELHVDSREGVGSTFTLYLPLVPNFAASPVADPAAPCEPTTQPGTIASAYAQNETPFNAADYQQLQGVKILLVDDDMRNTFALSRVLEMVGMNVILAENGLVALELLQQQDDVGIVLMDVMMPIMDGFEAMRRIRQDDYTAKLPIIALTAYAGSEDRDRCLEAGADDYLAKPVDRELLLAKISQHVPQNCGVRA